VASNGTLIQRDKRLVWAHAALDLGFAANTPDPFQLACRRVAPCPLLRVFPEFGEYVRPASEESCEKGYSFLRSLEWGVGSEGTVSLFLVLVGRLFVEFLEEKTPFLIEFGKALSDFRDTLRAHFLATIFPRMQQSRRGLQKFLLFQDFGQIRFKAKHNLIAKQTKS
jgi:hypothetical protein